MRGNLNQLQGTVPARTQKHRHHAPHRGGKVTSLELKATEITGGGHCTPRASSDMDVW